MNGTRTGEVPNERQESLHPNPALQPHLHK